MEVDVRLVIPELPAVAERCATRAVRLDDHAGTCQVFTTDTATGASRVVTDRPQGTTRCAIDPTGGSVWWFDDDATGVGVWRVQAFEGGPDRAALPGVPAGRSAGLAMTVDGTVALGAGVGEDVEVYLGRPGGAARRVARLAGHCAVVDVSPDGRLVAVGAAPGAPDAVRLLGPDGTVVARLSGVDGQVWAIGFRPQPGPATLLCVVEDGRRYHPALWTLHDGLSRVDIADHDGFDTEMTAGWYPDGRRMLIRRHRHARSHLYEVDLERRSCRPITTPPGSILAAEVQADGVLRYVWTRSGTPAQIRVAPSPAPAPPYPAGRGPDTDVWVDGPGGRIHALLTPGPPRADGDERPRPAVFLLHGGPFNAALDAYDPMVEIMHRIGFSVVRVNYRGSTGYGAVWRSAFDDGVGLTQVADVAAVHRHLVSTGVVDGTRTALVGESWGGYLALLAAGVEPDLWCGVAAVNPVADLVCAFRDTTPAVRALDTRLFGGTPDDVPSAYLRSSPITYAGAVRVPVLIVAGRDDVKCPPAQIRGYAEALSRHGGDIDVVWTGHGHEAHEAAGRIGVITAVIRHVGRSAGGAPEPAREEVTQ
jgi:acylaminoacyl-peptidase